MKACKEWYECLLYQVGIMKACSGISVYCIRLVEWPGLC